MTARQDVRLRGGDDALAEGQTAHRGDGEVLEHHPEAEGQDVVADVLGEQAAAGDGGPEGEDHELGDEVAEGPAGAAVAGVDGDAGPARFVRRVPNPCSVSEGGWRGRP
jgi:hypothetical protein